MNEGPTSETCPPIVGIGASAGGIEAFHGFFEKMPSDSGLVFVVVLHLPAHRESILPEILTRWTAMPVVVVTDGCLVEPNHVYVPPSGVSIVLRGRRLHLLETSADEPRELSPITVFFDSLASVLDEDAIGVVLSGTGNDGALGLKAIKAHGGLTLAQGGDGTAAQSADREETRDAAEGAATASGPRHEGMPASAIATGAVDIIAPVEAMPGHILAVREMRRQGQEIDDASEQKNAARLAICSVLHHQLGHDFSGYKENTFLRRVRRRMEVVRLTTLPEYIARLERDRGEVVMLFRDLLIGVTSFFRDPDMFEVVKQSVVRRLFEGKGEDNVIRVWVAGCATGEEAYSLAILLREHAEDLKSGAPKLQIFATDIDEAAISTARAGRFPASLLDGLTPARLTRFFIPSGDGTSYTVAREVRELCTFSVHSLIRDPPFSRIDLISCRNLLIYLDIDRQADVIPAFHYSLVPNGFLVLGSSESISRHEGLFATVDRTYRIFQRRDVPGPGLPVNGGQSPREVGMKDGSPPGTPRAAVVRVTNRAGARVLERFAPAFVVVAADGGILQFSSRTGRFLEPAAGIPTQNVLDMARPGLRAPLRAALKQAVDTGRPANDVRATVDIPGEGMQRISLMVEPFTQQGVEPGWLIVFLEGPVLPDESRADQVDHVADYGLEFELRDTRERLQSVTEEHETALEELRSANEELHSLNEELQSANEELETSKEEIQSMNEELQTVNGQLSGKVDELDAKNTDLRNLFESTRVATIFLDDYGIIRGFTPAVASLYNLIPSDVGRPLTDIMSRLRDLDLREDTRRVLATLEPLERRVAHEDGSTFYLMRILPYRTPSSTVDGTIVTFVDVSSIARAEHHQRLLVNELNHRVRNMLTVVISMATQTMRGAKSLEEFEKNYLGRVHALATAYTLLSNEAWRTVSLRDVVMEELRPFLTEAHSNVAVEGPPVPLQPQAALALGMAIHELTTNAVKYGALSVPTGHVSLTWRVQQGPEDQQLILRWIESGGPRVTPPTHRGFGMMLIERGLRQDMSAEVDLDFAPEGVKATLKAPFTPGDQPTASAGD